jgi:hypothetical protein
MATTYSSIVICSVSCFGKIAIEDGPFFAEGVKMYDHNRKHEFRKEGLYAFPTEFKVGEIKNRKKLLARHQCHHPEQRDDRRQRHRRSGLPDSQIGAANTIVMRKEELIFKQAKE